MVSFVFPLWLLLIFLLGKLEEMISFSFTKSANLWAFMLKEGCPSAIKNCSGHFLKLINPQVHNTLLTDITHFLSLEEEVDEPADTTDRMIPIAEGPYKALWTHFQVANGIPREARTLHHYTLNHLTFSTFTQHRGNSFVLVCCSSLPSIPAQIDSILQIPTKEIYFVIWLFLKTTLENQFQQHPVLQMSLWSQNLGQLVNVKPKDVESHFTCLPFEWQGVKCQAVISLSWVLFLFLWGWYILICSTGILSFFFNLSLVWVNESTLCIVFIFLLCTILELFQIISPDNIYGLSKKLFIVFVGGYVGPADIPLTADDGFCRTNN